MKIFINIASYRDSDLIRTVKDCYQKADHPDNLIFSVVSQADDNEHPDLSFIKPENLIYNKINYKDSKGVCWARELANKCLYSAHRRTDISMSIYYLQIDSHSRFKQNWDYLIKEAYGVAQIKWGNMIVFTNYPDPFELVYNDVGEYVSDKFIDYTDILKIQPAWDSKAKMLQASTDWPIIEDKTFGDECFFVSCNSIFCYINIMKEFPYDAELYFTGEEPSLTIRMYTHGVRIISPNVKYMYHNYNRGNSKRPLHWDDHAKWWEFNKSSYARLEKIMTGKDMGIYGINSRLLFNQYQKITGIDLTNKDYKI